QVAVNSGGYRDSVSVYNEDGTGPFFRGPGLNQLLEPVQVPVTVDGYGNFFGSPATSVGGERINDLNGFGNTVNAMKQSFRTDEFQVDIGSGISSPWANRLNQTAANVQQETGGLCLWINGQAGRTIYLLRRKNPYYFIFRLPQQNNLYPGDPSQFNPS